MAYAASAIALPAIDRHGLRQIEARFLAPEIYRRDDLATRQTKLARVVAKEIIPRLLRLHTEIVADAPPPALVLEALAPSRAEISGLAEIVLGSDLEAAARYVALLKDRGLALETLYVELLEPTARFLGEMWDRDECDFIDVTLGVARLQNLLALFNDGEDAPHCATGRRILMATTPGEQHQFGAALVARFLAAAGWQVDSEYGGSSADIARAAGRGWFAVVGLTAGSERQFAALRATIGLIRRRSANPAIGIMVGGPPFTARPEIAAELGADATAPDAPTAVLAAQKLFDLAAPRRRAGTGAPAPP